MNSNQRLELRFGEQHCWELDASDAIASFIDPSIEPLADVGIAIQHALQNPVEFPSLDQALVPGDTLVLVVDPVLPDPGNVLAEVVDWFVGHGVEPSNIGVVVAGSTAGQRATHAVLEKALEKWSEVTIEFHDPDDSDKIAYVAANDEAEPIYMNRTLVDADVVIPITCCRAAHALDYLGAYGLYPLLSDRKTLGDFYQLGRLVDDKAHERLTAWADQAAMWAGFMVEIQVVPAGANQVGEVYAGLTGPLEAQTKSRMEAIWRTELEPVELTIALLDGGAAQQDWLGIARALFAANRSTRDGGAIVVCTSAHERIGESLGRLKGNADEDALAKRIAKDNGDDAIAAAVIQDVCMSKHVYLAADIEKNSIESIGLGPLGTVEELKHLVGQFSSVAILGSAQHRDVVPKE